MVRDSHKDCECYPCTLSDSQCKHLDQGISGKRQNGALCHKITRDAEQGRGPHYGFKGGLQLSGQDTNSAHIVYTQITWKARCLGNEKEVI